MAFPDSTVEAEWRIAGGECECILTTHGHPFRCGKELVWGNRGKESKGSWEVNYLDGDTNNNSIANCAILCRPCHSTNLPTS